jgi:homoserine kinase type II
MHQDGHDNEREMLAHLSDYALVPPVECARPADRGMNNGLVCVRTGAGEFYLRSYASLSYADPASISYENELLAWLAGRRLSFTVPVPIPARDGRLVVCGPSGPFALTRRIPGVRLDPERLDHVELLGAATGELQAALQGYPAAHRPGRSLFNALLHFPLPGCDPLTLTPRDLDLPNAAPFEGLCKFWREEAAHLQTYADGVYRSLPTQLCHNDVTHNNALVDNGCISAVLDFEFATVTPRALDLAQGLRLTMRILDGPDPFAAARRFIGGYKRWVSLTDVEVQALPWLIRLRAALTVVWWLAQLPASRHVLPDRIEMVCKTVAWVKRHGVQLVDVIGREVLPY